MNAYERRPALIGPEGGPWLWEVPKPLVSRLGTMDEVEVIDAGPRWSTAFVAELQRLDPARGDVLDATFYTDALRRVCAFAKDALGYQQGLYEWVGD